MGGVVLGGWFVWLLVFVIGVGTFGIRFVLIPLISWIELSPLMETGLGLIPPAVLAALVFPNMIILDGSLAGIFLSPRFVAGSAAFVTAWYTDNMVATIGVGMSVLWGLQLVFV